MSDDEELDRLIAELRKRCDEATAERAKELLANMDRTYVVPIEDGQCALLGFDGELDAVWSIPAPLPEMLYRPLARRPAFAEGEVPARPTSEDRATYRRAGEFIYERVR